MLPEIGLTGQFQNKFIEFFGFKPAVWHSGITKKNKEIIWSGIVNIKLKLLLVHVHHYFCLLKIRINNC